MNPDMHKTSFRALRGLAALSLCFVFGLAYAQADAYPDADPPDRAARLSYLEGDVSLQPAGEEEWAAAIVNRPLTTGDKLWTDQGARAEIQVGRAAVRLGSGTGFSFLNVDDNTIQMRVTAGVINVSVRDLAGNEHIEIDTPNLSLSLLRPGNYRVEVNDNGDSTIVKVSEGMAEANGGSQNAVVHAQQVVTFNGVDQVIAQIGTLGAPDEFDSWSLERERREERAETSQTARYVAPDVTGYEDLEDNGTWNSEPEYGYVWTPRVAIGWAPYSYGRWAWVSPWGWTWIDDARWGYAPFHYGRWAHVRNRWCWVPGPRHVRAVYAPALVGWGGSHGGHVSWFPLGPREVYVPGRHYSRRYFERVNVANTTVNRSRFAHAIADRVEDTVYRNRVVPGGVTAVPRATFASAGHTGANRLRVSEQEQASSLASAIAPQITPVRASRSGERRANVRIPPQNIANRQVVVRRDPPPAAARYARRPPVSAGLAQAPDRSARPPVRGQVNDAADRGNGREAVVRNYHDRPPRTEPTTQSAPSVQTSVFDRRAIANAVQEDRERQGREGQRQREALQQREAMQQRDASQQREAQPQRPWQRQEDQARQQREQTQASRELQNRVREHAQRVQEVQRPVAPRPPEQRERPAQRERNAERPQAERPQVERPRSEARPPPAETRSQPRNREEGNGRSKRN